MWKWVLYIFCFWSVLPVSAQIAPQPDSTRRLEILRSGRYNFEKKDSVTSLLSLAVNVALKQEGTLFYSDSAVLNQTTNVVEAFGNIHINDGDSLHTYARYMRYQGNEKLALLKDNVKLVDNKGSVLTTKELHYDMNAGVANYYSGGKVVNKKTVLTSKEGTYYNATKDVIFKKGVVLTDPDARILTDSLQYNSQTERATFIAPTTIISESRKIFTTEGYYDLKEGKAYFTKRTSIIDSTYSVSADEMAFDNKEGMGNFKGNVVYSDTANGVSVLSDKLYVNKKTSAFLATDKPLMIIRQDQDSIFVRADTLYSGRITDMDARRVIPLILDTVGKNYQAPDLKGKDSSMNRFFEAWHHVRIFTDSVQAVCDSFFYAGTDSAFRMFRNPILWSSDSQITADTIYMFTRNKKAERLLAYFNGFIINLAGSQAYNQVRGNTINAWFKDGNIDYVRAKGRAESIYYAKDNYDKFIGMNKSTADAIDMFFENRKPRKIKFINDLKGVTYPIRQVPPDEYKLKGFNWYESRRPKSRFDLMAG